MRQTSGPQRSSMRRFPAFSRFTYDKYVDSKLSCPVYVARDLSGVFRFLIFSRTPKFFRAQLPEERRSDGRVTEGSSPSGAHTHPRIQ